MDDPIVREVSIVRMFEASREMVWRAWTEADELKRWFMPHGFTVPECEVVRHTVTFEGVDGKIELRIHSLVTKAAPELAAALAGMEEGWLQSLDKLEALLSGGTPTSAPRQLVATRVLDAPRETVWKAYTDLEALARWWPPPGRTMDTHGIDVRPGGTWRSTLHGPHGNFEQTITYVVVREPQTLAYGYGDPGQAGHTVFTTIGLEDEGGKTTVTVTLAFASAEERRRMVEESWAQQGLEGSLDRLATFVTA